jgi:hypothetical protein
MRMKVQHDTSMVVRKPSRYVDDAALQCFLGRESDGVHEKIEFSPIVADTLEHRLDLTWLHDIERHQNRCFDLARERLDIFLGFVVEVGDRELGTERAERLGAAPGNGLIVGNTHNEATLALEELGWDGGDQRRRSHFQSLIRSPPAYRC